MRASAPVLRRALKARPPSLAIERALWDAGHETVVGVDEVGRGAWAGPLSVGAAVLPPGRRVYKVRDSKLLTETEREALFDRIASWCRAWSVGHASHQECDELGMTEAQRLAARRAIEGLGLQPDHVVVDGRWDFVGGGRTQRLVRADALCLSVAAASILAKVTRDRIMRAEAEHFPGYDFDLNKGYPCPRHKLALAGMGPTSIHRRAWVFMDQIPWTALHRSPAKVDAAAAVGYLVSMSDDDTSIDQSDPSSASDRGDHDKDQDDDHGDGDKNQDDDHGDGDGDNGDGDNGDGDNGDGDNGDGDNGDGDKVGSPSGERLDNLQGDIDQVRKEAEEADLLEDPDEPKYHESGSDDDDMDDQAVTPPA